MFCSCFRVISNALRIPAYGRRPHIAPQLSASSLCHVCAPTGEFGEFEEMVRKDFVDIGLYPTYILPSMKRSPPLPSAVPFPHLWHLSIVVERTVLYIPTQSPLCTIAPFLCVTTRDPIAVLFNIIACVFCVTPHPCWHRGPLGQDCLSIIIARLPEAARGRQWQGACCPHPQQDSRPTPGRSCRGSWLQ